MSQALIELSNALAEATERAAAHVAAVHSGPRGSSSGIVWRAGLIVTADHALNHDEEIQVTLADQRVVAATLAGRDAATDLAVLKCRAGRRSHPRVWPCRFTGRREPCRSRTQTLGRLRARALCAVGYEPRAHSRWGRRCGRPGKCGWARHAKVRTLWRSGSSYRNHRSCY